MESCAALARMAIIMLTRRPNSRGPRASPPHVAKTPTPGHGRLRLSRHARLPASGQHRKAAAR
eukprot:6258516-Pyramimonas_sp.AAC.1